MKLLNKKGFSLVEVVLAIGIFLVTVLALVGLLGPTLKSVDEVEEVDEVASVVNSVNSFLQNKELIEQAAGQSKFDVIYRAVASGNHATIYVFREYVSGTSTNVRLKVGFASGEVPSDPSVITANTFGNAAGNIYRVVLSPSSVLPVASRSATRDSGTGIYLLSGSDPSTYPEGYFAMEVRIFSEDPPGPSGGGIVATDLSALNDLDPIFTYNTAVVR